MRFLQGDLSVLSLANLLQALVLNHSSGVLTLEAGLERRVLRVGPTGIRLIRGSQRCHRFERLLRGLRSVPAGPPGEDTPAPFASPEATTRLMSEWMLEEICELLTWARGTFRFHPFFDPAQQQEDGPFAAYGADVDVARIALEAARWADELPRIKASIPDLRAIPSRTGAQVTARKLRIDGEAMEDILRLIDGQRPVVHIVQESVFPRFIVLQVLHQLTRDGILVLRLPERFALTPPVSPRPSEATAAAAAA